MKRRIVPLILTGCFVASGFYSNSVSQLIPYVSGEKQVLAASEENLWVNEETSSDPGFANENVSDDTTMLEEVKVNDDEALPAEAAETQPTVLKIAIPEKLGMIIDPYRINGKEQIFSEDIVISNQNEFSVEMKLASLGYTMEAMEEVNRLPSCELFLTHPESGASYQILENGSSEIALGEIPPNTESVWLVTGRVEEGSEALWEPIKLNVKMRFQLQQAAP